MQQIPLQEVALMKRQAGFTLIELMIVIAIIGLLVAIVIPDLLTTRQQSEVEACKASLRGVQSALELYYTHYKYYPQALSNLVTEGYLGEDSDKDPWNTQFLYAPDSGGAGSGNGSSGQSSGGGSGNQSTNYFLGSAGPDRVPGNDDDVEPPINTKRHSFKSKSSSAGGGSVGGTGQTAE